MADGTRKRPMPNSVPSHGDPDRKRVLNVLAQRRYRQRRREKLAELEAKAQASSSLRTPAESLDISPAGQPNDVQDSIADLAGSGDFNLEPSFEDLVAVEEITRESKDFDFPTIQFDQDPSLDLTLFQDYDLNTLPINSLPSPLPSTPSNPSPFPPLPTLHFPLSTDSNLLVPCLPILRAGLTIATLLDVATEIFNPFYTHVLPQTLHPSLPRNYHPTPAQLTIPHHPVLDTLPWPSVREKLICMFAMPPALRPRIARDEEGTGQEGVMRIVHDIDDYTEGFKVHGNAVGWDGVSELDESAWEVGEAFFRNWWWCLEPKVLEATNQRRLERGLGMLRLEGKGKM